MAGAADVVADKLLVKNGRAGNGNLLMVLSKDASITLPGAAQDPRCAPIGSGERSIVIAAFDFESVPGGCSVHGDYFTELLPCEGWKFNGRNTYSWTRPPGYEGACRSIVVKPGRLKIVCGGPGMSLTLGQTQDAALVSFAWPSADLPLSELVYYETGYDAATGCRVPKDGSDGQTFLATHCTAPMTACSP
jgi:hypothetical protein